MGVFAKRPPDQLPAREERRRRRLGRAAIVAAIVHVQLAVLIGVIVYRVAPRTLEGVDPLNGGLSVQPLDEQAARELIAELDAEKAREEEKKPEEKPASPPEQVPGQVVELPRPVRETPPKQARFVAEHDSSVERETRKLGKLEANAASGGTDHAPAPPTPPSPPAPPSPPQPALMAMRGPEERGAAAEPASAPSPDGPPPIEESDDGLLPRAGHLVPQMRRPSRGAAPSLASLMPTGAQVARALGSGTEDHLPDVDEGDETSLNARAWRFASFFNRVKRQVRQNWTAVDEYNKRDPTGEIYGAGQRSTVLRISLTADGRLAGCSIVKPSGVDFLDDVAIEAVKRAQPFANPPAQLVTADGNINFRFGFFFDIGNSPKMRVFRYTSM